MAPAIATPTEAVDAALRGACAPLYLQLQRRVRAELLERLPREGCPVVVLCSTLEGLGAELHQLGALLELRQAVTRSAPNQEAYERALLETARLLGANRAELKKDRAAISRWLNGETLLERGRRRANRLRRIEQLGVLALAQLLREAAPGEVPAEAASLLEGLLLGGLKRLDHPLIEREYVRAADAALRHLETPRVLLDALFEVARDPRRDLWSQCRALKSLLQSDPERGLRLAQGRLLRPVRRSQSAFYLRRFVLDDCLGSFPLERRLELIKEVLRGPDPSAHVRQGAVLALGRLPCGVAWSTFVEEVLDREEPAPQVTASANLVLAAWTEADPDPGVRLAAWCDWLAAQDERLVVQIGLERFGRTCETLLATGRLAAATLRPLAGALLAAGTARGWNVTEKRRAERVLGGIEAVATPRFAELRHALEPALRTLAAGQTLELGWSGEDEAVSPDELGAFLAWASRDCEGFYAEARRAGYRITACGKPVVRAWRILHETFTPAPDKRQGHPTGHLRGWLRPGSIRAHSELLGEESPTRTPGEPVICREEGSWRRFLPLVDDFLDSLGREQVSVYSDQGVVRITPPRGLARWRTWLQVTLRYPRLSALRNEVRLGNPELDPGVYVETFRELGFKVEFEALGPALHSSAAAYFTTSSQEDLE